MLYFLVYKKIVLLLPSRKCWKTPKLVETIMATGTFTCDKKENKIKKSQLAENIDQGKLQTSKTLLRARDAG